MTYLIITAFLISSCASGGKNPPESPSVMDDVAVFKEDLCARSLTKYNVTGWTVSRCDGLLFTALHGAACGYVSLLPFEVSPGEWSRSPDHGCFIPPGIENGAKSTISKDMYAGLLLWIAHNKDLAMAERTLAYCKNHMVANGLGCQVGKAIDTQTEIGTVILPVTMIQFMEHLVMYIKSQDLSHAQRFKPGPMKAGFEGHLQVIHQLTEGIVYGNITDDGRDLLLAQASRQPHNALYVGAAALYSGGGMDEAVRLLMTQFKSGRLPTSDDHCSDYIYQRDESPKDWEPCPDEENEFYGTDAVFAAAVILGEIK